MKKLLIPFLVILIAGCSREIIRYHGHDYRIIEAGGQKWLASNLKTDRYMSGRRIELVNDVYRWPDLTTRACGFYRSDTARLSRYGMVYNWKAVDGGKLCPLFWRVPKNSDWLALEDHLGGGMRAGGKLKSVKGWQGKHVSGDDIGFNALAAGYRLNDDMQEGQAVVWWSSSIARMNDLEDKKTGVSYSASDPYMKWIWGRRLESNTSELMITVNRPNNGFYVRCMRGKAK